MKERFLPEALGVINGVLAGYFGPEFAHQLVSGSNWPNWAIDFFRSLADNEAVKGGSAVFGGTVFGGIIHLWISGRQREIEARQFPYPPKGSARLKD